MGQGVAQADARGRSVAWRVVRRVWPAAVLMGLMGVWLWILLTLGGNWWRTHSTFHDVYRGMAVAQAWREGLWDARWFSGFDFGYGYPFLSFYAPLFHWLTGLLTVVTGSARTGVCINIAFWLMVGTAGMYHAGRAIWVWISDGRVNGRLAGLLAGAGWLMSPYLLCDIYVRGDGAEFAAAQTLPWVVWAAVCVLTRRGRMDRRDAARLLLLILIMSAGILLHNFLGLVVFGFALAMVALLGLMRWLGGGRSEADGNALRRYGTYLICLATVLGATAFFWVPAWREMQFVQVDVVKQGRFTYANHFGTLYQALKVWHWGYGHSGLLPGPNPPLARHLGWVALVALVSVVMALVLLAARRSAGRRRILWAIGLLLAGSVAAYLLVFPISKPIWEQVRVLQFAQFPWRMLILPTVGVCLLLPAGMVVGHLTEPTLRARLGWVIFWPIVVAMCFVISQLNYAHSRVRPMEAFTADQWAVTRILTADLDEYASIWRKRLREKTVEAGTIQPGDGVAVTRVKRSGTKSYITLTNAGPAAGWAVVAYNYFPGWQACMDETGAAVSLSPSVQGFIRIDGIAPGESKVRLWFGDTPVRRYSKMLSGGVWVVWVGAWVILAVRRWPRGRGF